MQVAEDVIAVLDRGTCEGNGFVLPEQLDRKDYVKVNKVLVAAGGKWNRSAKAHLFDCPAEDAVSDIVLTGTVIDVKKDFDFFATPPHLAARMVEKLKIVPGMRVLEPSAGTGNLATEAANAGGLVDCFELNQDMYMKLANDGNFEFVVNGDFMQAIPVAKYDRVIMNPPFSKQADIRHVTTAIRWMKPRAGLCAVMASGVLFRQNRLTTDFRALVDQWSGYFEELDPGTFKGEGTMVNTVLLTIPPRD